MTRRSPLVCLFAVACLGTLALTSRAAAKPPDLPVNPNDTIPVLTSPPFDMLPPGAEVEPSKPQPLQGFPPITIQSSKGTVSLGSGIWESPSNMTEEVEPTTLTVYPGPNGVVVSIDPDPMPASQTMTIYHPVRPRMPLSVQCAFEKCLLFGVNPLLSLVPLPESLREEEHRKVEIPISPMPQAATEGSLLFGVGVNSDAGLTGNLMVGITPADAAPDPSIPPSPGSQEGSGAPHNDMPQTCPYACDRHVPAIADIDLSDSVLESLQKLIDAETLFDQARELVKDAKYADAIDCLNKACALCPTSRYKEMAAEIVSSMVWRFFSGRHEDADTEEQAQPPIQCEPDWYDDEDTCPKCPPALPRQASVTPQVVIQALVAEIDLNNASDLLRAGGEAPIVISTSQYTFDRLLRTLKERGCLDVLSHPQVQTADNQSAHVFIGQQFPIVTGVTESNGFATESVEYEPVGVDLMVTPRIESDGRIVMRMVTSVSSPQPCDLSRDGGTTAEVILQQALEVTAVARDGETVAIVGANQSDLNKNEVRVPYLGELPVIGSLFRYRQKTKSTSALLVLLTPHVIRSEADEHSKAEQESKQSRACPPVCGVPCEKEPPVEKIAAPRCDDYDFNEIGRRLAGVDEEVSGLMKACHLALSCGRHAKAAQLAREAYALDAERVAADPIVYKMHILACKMAKDNCCCDDDCCCEPCDNPDCCCHAKAAKAVVEMQLPALPAIDPNIVIELQKLMDEGTPSVSEAKPNLEVIEEESEAPEVPKAVAKPYHLQTPAANMVISYDDLLRIIPGETWTELDLKTKRVRVLWRVRVGEKVYRVRYDGGLSVDLNVMPTTGSVENCEDPR